MASDKPKKRASGGEIMRIEGLTLMRSVDEKVVSGISFEVYKGEFLSIIGSSGAGKTTLLQALAGLLQPSEGKIYFRGKALERPTARIGLVYQDYALFPWRTAQGNVEFGLELLGVKSDERKRLAEEALDLMGILEHRDKYPVQLSGGMQQRVAIARVLVNKPEVLMLDEAFSALDVQTRRKLEEQLLQIQKELGITVILVTHLVEQALALSDRAMILSKGKIEKVLKLEDGKPRDVDAPEFRGLLRETEGMIKATPKLDIFVNDLARLEKKISR
ncbi:MAG TPA: ABC transporter ATP-binding protein [Candidatus Bilamarchaeum sp.]|nr:ABC transporter ATP-binding protein [Candidatus Bilamarchaeum sp.]